jgi:hypothetical protein
MDKGAPGTALGAAFRRVALDQFMFAPVGLACFFTFMTVAEGGGREKLRQKFADVYVPALKANYVVWPAVQMLNFRVMPLQFQIVSGMPIELRDEMRLTCGVAFCVDGRDCMDGILVVDQRE